MAAWCCASFSTLIQCGSPEFLRQGEALASGAVIKHFGPTHLKQMKIVLPPIDEQRKIVAEVSTELSLVDADKELIHRFEEKIKQTINRVWGEEE